MANQTSHLRQALHNHELADELASQQPMKYIDWVVTTLFYATVHYFESYWANWGWHSDNYDDRKSYIEKHFTRDIKIRINYRTLAENSWLVRYLNKDVTNSDIAVNYFNEADIKEFFSKVQEIKTVLKIN